jgi:hypothetical protein
VNSPLLVTTVAVYFFAASMHMGGGSAKVMVRGDVPSAFGHGVVPVMAAPGTVVGWNTVVAGVVEATDVALVAVSLSSPPLTSSETP